MCYYYYVYVVLILCAYAEKMLAYLFRRFSDVAKKRKSLRRLINAFLVVFIIYYFIFTVFRRKPFLAESFKSFFLLVSFCCLLISVLFCGLNGQQIFFNDFTHQKMLYFGSTKLILQRRVLVCRGINCFVCTT